MPLFYIVFIHDLQDLQLLIYTMKTTFFFKGRLWIPLKINFIDKLDSVLFVYNKKLLRRIIELFCYIIYELVHLYMN